MMLDTVKFYSRSKINDYTDKETLVDKLDQARETYDFQTGEYYLSGKIKNIQIQEHAYGFYIQGSLPKYYFGNNFKALTITQLADCVTRLSEDLDLPVADFGISRLDVTDNISMTYGPRAYFDCLHSCTWFEKSLLPNGVRFANNSRALNFYDKVEERKNKRQTVPPGYRHKNLFRYEYRMDERIGDFLSFAVPNITAFYNVENCARAIEGWRRQFDAVRKIEPSLTKVSDLSTLLKYRDRNEIEYLLQKGGEGAALDEVELLYQLGKYTYRKQVTREKTRINKLFEKYHSVAHTGYSFKTELCERVHQQAETNKRVLLQ